MISERHDLKYETSLFIFVGGDTKLSPAEITSHLGINPVKTSDTPLKRNARRPPGWITWFYKTENSDKLIVDSIDNRIVNFLNGIKEISKKFSSLPQDCEKELVVTVFCDDLTPNVILSPSTMGLVSRFGLLLRIALYCGCDEEIDKAISGLKGY